MENQSNTWKKLQNGSDIRGVAMEGIPGENINLTEEVSEILGKAFAHWLCKKEDKESLCVAVGMDSRLTGPLLKKAFISGLTSVGVDVYDCGIASTPAMFMATVDKNYSIDAGVMLTASHLPYNRNGLKFFTGEGGANKSDITEILTLAAEDALNSLREKGTVQELDYISIYSKTLVEGILNGVKEGVDRAKPLKGLKIIVDAGNGAGGFFANKVLKELGADVSGSQFLDPDGKFPNHVPNPEDSEAMASICQAVKQERADLGIIFDTDVDRSAIVDNQGNPINRNELIALISAVVLEEHPSSTIVTDSITSDGLAWFIKHHLKGKHKRFKRGYKNVINESLRLNEEGEESWLAIETSGHAALKENFFLDDGAFLVAKLLVKMADLRLENKNLSQLIEVLPRPVESKEFRIKITKDDFVAYGQQVIDELENNLLESWSVVPENYEGIRVQCKSPDEDGWFLVRLSLHDPVIPVNIESNTKGGVGIIASKLKDILTQFKDLDLNPFDKN
ncbi:phosphoglucomutase [Plebeiibacterium marinum]|uniref:Phosphoglucomutase n=1 Tax=Plebeiibacterium marinum TaxID=2992111 RepID=A0AAE3MFX2_9BACT|nr:phosphoglucomutase [Plebeiobacterium marinum]MCW3806850.1 phosphoglucomutase [Plebeiobacterium marinum]